MFGIQTRLLAYGLSAILVVAVLSWLFLAGRSAGIKHDAKRSAPIIAGLQTKLATCQATVDGLTVALEHQNTAVEALRIESDERAKRAAEAIRRAQEQAQGYRVKADRLSRAKPTGDVCVAARDLIVSSLSEDRK